MASIVSLVDVRNERVKGKLVAYAAAGETVIIETRNGSISAEKIMCRTTFAEILNSFGDYFVIEYADIRDMRSASRAQTSVVNVLGDWAFTPEPPPARMNRVLHFPVRARRT